MAKVVTAEQAAALIKDGATIGASAIVLAGWPEEVAMAIEKRFLETEHPKGLTFTHASGIGDWKTKGASHFAHPGLVKRWIGAHTGLAPAMAKMIIEGGCEGFCLPQGVICQLWREIAAKRPGLITKIGLGTFVDPRLEGGRMNSNTHGDIVKVIELQGEEWMLYPTFPVDVAIIRGTLADEDGNLTADDEGVLMECLPLAQAAKNSGGIVIAQVKNLVKSGTLHPKNVRVPGVLVDYVVVAKEENHWQSGGTVVNRAFSGDIKVSLGAIPPMALDERLVIARRAAMELTPGSIVNLGIGMPDGVAIVAGEEGAADLLTLTTEAGAIGGVPAGGENFAMSFNAQAFVEQQAQFDWYDGGGLDQAFLGAAEVDEHGNVNVSKFKGRCVGCGGFINITQNAKKVVYCGTFTAGGLKVKVADGKLVILQEGKGKKYVKTVEQVTFSGAYANKTGQPVLFVTERAVFELIDGKVTLTEVAPGIDLEKDILAQMEFTPAISPHLKPMPAELFQPNLFGLRKIIETKKNAATAAAAAAKEEIVLA
ncbi:MAG: acyl CoA:acetate/3-ketoacid CoA transferase [Acidobacteriota bacterium]|nr:acyl CoA:acetate/3-ketoacid CoA transferase [Acidobacteriota bacterium]